MMCQNVCCKDVVPLKRWRDRPRLLEPSSPFQPWRWNICCLYRFIWNIYWNICWNICCLNKFIWKLWKEKTDLRWWQLRLAFQRCQAWGQTMPWLCSSSTNKKIKIRTHQVQRYSTTGFIFFFRITKFSEFDSSEFYSLGLSNIYIVNFYNLRPNVPHI